MKIIVNRTRQGFTLTEMLVVLGILAFVMAATVPMIMPMIRPREMDRADAVIRTAVLRARTLAIERREKFDLILDQAANQLRIRPVGILDRDWFYGGVVSSYDPATRTITLDLVGGIPDLTKIDIGGAGKTYYMLITRCTHTYSVKGQINRILTDGIEIDDTDPADVKVTVRLTADWSHGTPEQGDEFIITTRDIAADEVLSLPPNIHLLRGRFPEAITFAPSGGLTSGTNLLGFYYIGPTVYEGSVDSVGTETLTVAGAPWKVNAYAGLYCVITKSDAVGARARLITDNTDDTLTITPEEPWELNRETGVPQPGDRFAIVLPDNVRQVFIYSTTGQVETRYPKVGR